MVSNASALKSLAASHWPTASLRATATWNLAPGTRAGAATEAAGNNVGAQVRTTARGVGGGGGVNPATMVALLRMQEQRGVGAPFDWLEDVLGNVLHRLAEYWDRKTPKPPAPHDPPPAVPAPAPAPSPPVSSPPLAVVDDPAPVRYLESVLERLRAQPASRTPDQPFSRRAQSRTTPPPASAFAALGVFYTPGVFTQTQAGALRTLNQAQAGLALLQAAAYSRPPPITVRVGAYA